MFLTRVAQIILAAGAICDAATVFNFDNDPLGIATNFTDTVGGLSATFSTAAIQEDSSYCRPCSKR